MRCQIMLTETSRCTNLATDWLVVESENRQERKVISVCSICYGRGAADQSPGVRPDRARAMARTERHGWQGELIGAASGTKRT